MVVTRSAATANGRRRQDNTRTNNNNNNSQNNNKKKKRSSSAASLPPPRRQPKRRCKATNFNNSNCQTDNNNNNNNILNMLDKDSLLQVLLRYTDGGTGSGSGSDNDHTALWHTCREFRQVLNSSLFAQQRAKMECAAVQARPWTGQELFHYNERNGVTETENNYFQAVLDGEYNRMGRTETPGVVSNKFSIRVDGITVGQGTYFLVDRNTTSNNRRNNNFHAICDGQQELQQVATLFFNRRGGFRIPQVQQAAAAAAAEQQQQRQNDSMEISNNRKKSLLYISRLKLHPLYRGEEYTWIGATAIRSLLQHETLRDKWGIVIYIGDSHAQFLEADIEQHRRMSNLSLSPLMELLATMRGGGGEGEEDQDQGAIATPTTTPQDKKQWQERLDVLAQQDLKQFLRAGFVQTEETVVSTPLFHVFMLPHFLQQAMLSAKETAQITIVQKSQFSLGTAPVREQDTDLLQYMVKACGQRKRLQERWESLSQSAPASTDQARLLLDQGFQSMVEDQVTNSIHELDESLQEQEVYFEMLRNNLESTRRELETSSTVLEGMHTAPALSAVSRSQVRRLELNLQSLQDSIQNMEAEVAAKEAVLTQARQRRAALNVDDMLSRVWDEYRSQRDEMAESMFTTAREAVKEALEDIQKHDQTVRTEVMQRVQQDGASITNSNVLHACAANLLPRYMDLMLEFVPESEHRTALNKRDQNGTTPLMAAAATEGSDKQEKVRYETLEKLIDLGVDKNITNGCGETALGELRRNKRSRDDFRYAFQSWSRHDNDTTTQNLYTRMEQLLRPFGGPTAADEAILEDISSETDQHVGVRAILFGAEDDSDQEELIWVF